MLLLKKIGLGVVALAFLAGVGSAFADTPTVISFNGPSSLNSDQIAGFNWTISGGGHTFTIFCSQGIKIKYATGAVFPCDQRVSISSQASDGVSLTVANVSGSPRVVTARIIPKDSGGVDYDSGAQTLSFYVSPSQYPITSFTTTATTTVSGQPVPLAWIGPDLDGVNLKIQCADTVTATSTTYGSGVLPCGQIVFPADLSGTGTLSIQFSNSSANPVPVTVTLLPAMSPGVYDATHAASIALSVASDAQQPVSVPLFQASRTSIFSGDSVQFMWKAINVSGVNFKFSCNNALSLQTFTATSTNALQCGDFAWGQSFPANGTTSVAFFNSGPTSQSLTVTLFPRLKDMTYLGAQSATLRVSVDPYSALATGTTSVPSSPTTVAPGSTVPQVMNSVVPTGPLTAPTPIQSAAASTGSVSSSSKTPVFTRPMQRGDRGAAVRALQQFLKKDPALYPEGLVTGYFGAATERALGRFQIANKLIQSGSDAAYGFLGPKTRLLLNSLQ